MVNERRVPRSKFQIVSQKFDGKNVQKKSVQDPPTNKPLPIKHALTNALIECHDIQWDPNDGHLNIRFILKQNFLIFKR